MAESATRTESVRMYVMRPTGPSAPTSIPSYSCWASRIVTAAEKPSCLAASCCNVLVRNGGGAARRRSPVSTAVTLKGILSASATIARAVASSLISGFLPSSLCSRAWNPWPSFSRSASMVQYSCGTNLRISSTRSQISRSATVCTAPAEQPRRGGLPPPRREAGLDAFPQQRRRLVAHQPVEHAPRLLGVHLALVDVERVGEGVGDRVLGDLVEQDAPHLAPVAQLARDVPGDRLALAVRVGGEEHPLRRLGRLLDLGEGLGLFLDGHVFGREAVLHVHAQLALRQVAHVPHGRLHGIARAEVLPDGLCLGGRFDDDERALPAHGGGRLGLPYPLLGSHGHGGVRASVFPGLAPGVSSQPDLGLLLHCCFLSCHVSILRQTTRERIFTIPHSIAQA